MPYYTYEISHQNFLSRIIDVSKIVYLFPIFEQLLLIMTRHNLRENIQPCNDATLKSKEKEIIRISGANFRII